MAQRGRLEQIRQIVRLEKKVVVANLSSQFGVTPEAIWRGLEKLEEEGLVIKTYGGAVLNQTESPEKINSVKHSETNTEEKRAIAGIVFEMVPPNADVGCDAGLTVMEALEYLSEREDILVLTDFAKVIGEMEWSRLRVLSTGGHVNRQSHFIQDGVAWSTIQEYHLDMVLISCKGMSMEGGIFDSHELEAGVKKFLVEQGHKVYLPADYPKLDCVAFMKPTDLEQIDAVAMDRKPSDEWMRLFNRNHIEVYYS